MSANSRPHPRHLRNNKRSLLPHLYRVNPRRPITLSLDASSLCKCSHFSGQVGFVCGQSRQSAKHRRIHVYVGLVFGVEFGVNEGAAGQEKNLGVPGVSDALLPRKCSRKRRWPRGTSVYFTRPHAGPGWVARDGHSCECRRARN